MIQQGSSAQVVYNRRQHSKPCALIFSPLTDILRGKWPCSELFWSAFFPHFPAFGLNTERYSVSLSIQSECEKMRTRIIPNTDILHGVFYFLHLLHFLFWMLNSGIWVFPKSLFRKKFNTSSLEEMFLWNSRKTFIFPRKPEGILHHNFLTTSLNYDTIK